MEIQNGTLSPKHREAGLALYLAPADNLILNLIYEGHVVKSFGKTATAEEIHKEADKWLKELQNKINIIDNLGTTGYCNLCTMPIGFCIFGLFYQNIFVNNSLLSLLISVLFWLGSFFLIYLVIKGTSNDR